MPKIRSTNNFKKQAQFALFITSYLPLFFLIVFKQIYINWTFLNWGGFNVGSISVFLQKFGLAALLLILGIYGFVGAKITLKNIERTSVGNSFSVKISNLKNKNSEAISYIATYIIPFAFQKLDSWFELISITLLIGVIYRIYINSSLLLINPILNLKYSIYEFEFKEGERYRDGLLITKDKYLNEDESIVLYEIGSKMYYSKSTEHD